MGFMDKIRDFDPDKIPMVKLGLHAGQLVLAIVIVGLDIAVFTGEKSKINSKIGWTFGACFLSIPAWIYLAMAPRYERTRRIAQAHAMTVVDAIWTIIWLSAFATQVSYNAADSCGKVCDVSSAAAGIAFFEFLLWVMSTLVSGYTLNYFNFHGHLPGYDKLGLDGPQNIDPDKAAFSMAPHDEEAYAPINMDDHHDDDHSNPYNAGSYGGSGMFQDDTAYRPQEDSLPPQNPFAQSASPDPFGGSYQSHSTINDNPYSHDPYSGPSAGSYGGAGAGGSHIYAPPADHDYDDHPAQFPAANYDRTLP